jgi:hypothetical protein
MLYLSKTSFVYRFYKILVIEPTTEVKAESIGAPSVKEIDGDTCIVRRHLSDVRRVLHQYSVLKTLQIWQEKAVYYQCQPRLNMCT